MALVLSFRCGRCGKEYAVYYPKALVYPLYGHGTREQGPWKTSGRRPAVPCAPCRSGRSSRGKPG